MNARAPSWMLLSLLVACGANPQPTRPNPAPSTKGGALIGPSAAATAAATQVPAVDRDTLALQVTKFLQRWVETQNANDLTAYMALYDGEEFSGVRRTASGEMKTPTRAAWESDRKPLFSKKQRVAAEGIEVASWHDGIVAAFYVEVRFVQRWQGGQAADHGPKVMRLKLSDESQLSIVYEELLSSTNGWRDEKVTKGDGTMLKSPITARLGWTPFDQYSVVLTLSLEDSAGAKRDFEVPLTRCTSDGRRPAGVVAPSAVPKFLFDTTSPCGNEIEMMRRVLVDGAGIVVKARTVSAPHDDAGHVDTGWDDLLRVELAPRAVVNAR